MSLNRLREIAASPFPAAAPVRRRFSSSTCESLQLSAPQQETYNATVTSRTVFQFDVLKVRKGGLTEVGIVRKKRPLFPLWCVFSAADMP